jgi:hypothetical protein
MKEKIKIIFGEEFYDMGPAFLTALIVIAGIAALIIKSLNFNF